MTLVKYNSETNPRTFSNLLNKFFSDVAIENRFYKFLPDVDFVETEKSYELHAAVPGLTKEDFHIEISDGLLTISGERKFVNEEKGKTYRSVETRFGAFSRSFQLPDAVDTTNVEAEYTNGILKINIPKDEAKKLKSKITVK